MFEKSGDWKWWCSNQYGHQAKYDMSYNTNLDAYTSRYVFDPAFALYPVPSLRLTE